MLSPERLLAMKWIFEALGGRLKYREREEGIWVRKWRSEYGRGIVRPTIEAVRSLVRDEGRNGLGIPDEMAEVCA